MFGFLKKKKKLEPTEEELRWNKLWDLWADGKIESPYQELMTYQGEINNGGHSQYFTNTENCGDIEKDMSALNQLLSPELAENLQNAYKAHLSLDENPDDDKAEEAIEQCDNIFYENEEEITKLLESLADKIEL